jgi:hypothetical protein
MKSFMIFFLFSAITSRGIILANPTYWVYLWRERKEDFRGSLTQVNVKNLIKFERKSFWKSSKVFQKFCMKKYLSLTPLSD